MEILSKLIAGSLLLAGAVVLGCTLGALTGAFSGWVLSMFMPNWTVIGFSKFGITIIPKDMIAIGAVLGFVGGFFRSSKDSK